MRIVQADAREGRSPDSASSSSSTRSSSVWRPAHAKLRGVVSNRALGGVNVQAQHVDGPAVIAWAAAPAAAPPCSVRPLAIMM